MRTLLLILFLTAAAGGLLWLVLDQDRTESDVIDDGGPAAGDPEDDGDGMLRVDALSPVEVVPAGKWDPELDIETPPAPHSDPRFMKIDVQMESDEDWVPTGARVLEIFQRHMGRKSPIRFRDQAELDEFRAKVWEQPHPSRLPLAMLLESCTTVGFRPALRPGAVYLIKIREP